VVVVGVDMAANVGDVSVGGTMANVGDVVMLVAEVGVAELTLVVLLVVVAVFITGMEGTLREGSDGTSSAGGGAKKTDFLLS